MVYIISPISPKDAQEISTWTYDPPYDLYSMSSEDTPGFLRAEYRYHVLLDEDTKLVGYCCFGEDALVPGGDYTRGEPEVLDLGIGMRPDLTSKGFGKDFVKEILAFASRTYQPSTFRVTVAAFNQRSIRTFQRLGFKETHQFTRDLEKIKFVQLERPVGNSISNNTLQVFTTLLENMEDYLMTNLASKPCLPCRGDEKPLFPEQIEEYLVLLPDWKIVEREGIPRLERSFPFPDFKGALNFTNQVGEMAEEVDHHPAILVSWGRAAVSWWTHVVNGLHENDFIMAARTNDLYQ